MAKKIWFNLPESAQPNQVYGLELDIISKESGAEIILDNVHFAHNSYELDKRSYEELDKLITYLHKYPEVNIVIEGHTDDVGGEADNQLLSKTGPKQYSYLLDALIKKERLEYIGYGEKPLVANTTQEDRAQNRRTSFRVK